MTNSFKDGNMCLKVPLKEFILILKDVTYMQNQTLPYFPTLEAEIAKSGILKKDIAQRLGISQRTFSKKLNGDVDFWWNEILIIYDIFPDVPPHLLFNHNKSA